MKIIEQTIEFAGASPQDLFETYMDAARHSAAIGTSVTIGRRSGSEFRAFGDGGLCGTILHVVPNRMIVQTWRAQRQWRGSELDSILVLIFETASGGARIQLLHSGVPERDYELFSGGWHERYWKPWRAYLSMSCKHGILESTMAASWNAQVHRPGIGQR